MFEALDEVVPVARRLGVRFVGQFAELNPLLDLAVERRDHYDNVMHLIEEKREAAGLPPLDTHRKDVEQGDRTAYMADFMARKRQRERKAAEIENMLRPESQQLIGRSRLEFMQLQSAKWKKQLDALIEARRREAGGERVKRAELDALRQTFWDSVDRELDEMEEYARKEGLKPPHQRRPYKK
jgi:hypothetical protein